jgi:hypothetical protein
MMTPEKLPQRQGLPTGSGGTKQMPDGVEHFELACTTWSDAGGFGSGAALSMGRSAGVGGPMAATASPAQPATAIMPNRTSRIV